MTISFLQAKYGDCIHLCHNQMNVVIDTGTIDSDAFNQLVENVKSRNQRINLLVITHYDRDHIGGLMNMSPDDWGLVDTIWFNSAKGLKQIVNDGKHLSLKDAEIIHQAIEKFNVNWDRDLFPEKVFNLEDNWSLKILYGGYDKIPEQGGEYLTTPKSDWNSTLDELEKYLNDKVLDKSEPNSSSIILLLSNGTKNVLLSGDATPETLLKALSSYSEDNQLVLDLFKLPHHGSYKNLTEQILQVIKCNDYMILTNGERYCHPDKKMMLKVLKWGKKNSDEITQFHLNYYNELNTRLNISEEEKAKYKFELDGKSVFEI